jgi:predicted DNA-binding protein (UPF0278 family)
LGKEEDCPGVVGLRIYQVSNPCPSAEPLIIDEQQNLPQTIRTSFHAAVRQTLLDELPGLAVLIMKQLIRAGLNDKNHDPESRRCESSRKLR